mgnify:FL=1
MDKEETGRQPPEGPILCANNCGFFGSTTTMNFCSQCYRNVVMKQAKASEVVKQHSHVTRSVSQLAEMGNEKQEVSSSSSPAIASLLPSPPPPNRCFACKKRVGLTGFKCRCGNQFCAVHRYSDQHDCSFDYHSAARDSIAKANPVIKAEKIDKI